MTPITPPLSMSGLPDRIESVAPLEQMLSEPAPALVAMFSEIEGDLLILGVAGKMGPSVAAVIARRFVRSRR